MSERATRPLNKDAVKAADDDLYSKHADDPRPNALYDENGKRRPLDANDPDQADLRSEWMDSYKANGGETEPVDNTGSDPAQPVKPCRERQRVDPLIDADQVDIDQSKVEAPQTSEYQEDPEQEGPPVEDEQPADGGGGIAVAQRLKESHADSDTDNEGSDVA